MTTAPTPLAHSGVISTGVGAGRSDDVARKMNHHSVGSQGSVTSAGAKRGGGGAMVDSYLSSFNNVAITTTTTTTTTGTTPRLEDYEDDDDDDDEVFHDNNVTLLSAASCPFRPLAKKGPFPPVPPQPAAVSGRGKPPLKQSLGDLPGLSIVTWEEFLESPSVLCGLFEVDRDDFIRYNSQQVNVFFHDSRMEQPTLGAPSGDGLSWTIFIDSYNHLRSVRTWLTERVSVILLQLMKGKGKARAACLVAINPLNQSVGAQLNDSFSRVIDAFLQQRNFSIEVNLNSCVQTWCRTVLKMPCCVSGGRLVVTNAEESVPCTRVTSVSFCVLCFPVWGCQKLSYRFKRHTQYEDCFLYFKAEDLALCTKSPTLMQYAEKNNTNNNTNHVNGGRREEGVMSEGKPKPKPWIKKNRKAVTTATQTLDTDDDPPLGHMDVEEVVDEEKMGVEDRRGRQQQQHGGETERNQHSTVSSATGGSHTMQGLEPQTSNCFPSHRPAQSVTSRLRDPSQQEHGDLLAGSKSNLLSVSTVSSSSCSTLLPTADRVTLSSVDPTPRDGAHVIPVGSLQHPGMEEEEEEGGEDSLSLHTPLTPRTPRGGPVWEDPRSAGLDSMSTLPSVGSDDEHGGGRYRLQPDTPSPRPDTPFHKGLPPQARKLARVQMVHDVIVDDESEEQGAANPWPPGGERVHHLKGSTAADLPPEPGSKRRKKRISKALRDMTGRGGQQTTADSSSAGPPHLRGEEGGLSGRYNQAFVQDEVPSMEGSSVRRMKNGEKVKYTPIKGLNENSAAYRAFPITSELLDFIGKNSKNKSSCNPSKNSQDQKPKKKNSSAQKAEDMLFASRFVLTEDRHNRNCLSDNDMVDDDFGDMEPDSVMSDVEGVASPRLIPVKKTERTISINSVYTPRSEADTDWEITDCELEGNARREGPKILAGARGAQQLRSTSANRTRESSTASSADPRRRGGIQNDSRRRYIALNSLRRKANQLALQAELRRQQKRPDSSGSARMEVQDV